jgi:hypothetical protein
MLAGRVARHRDRKAEYTDSDNVKFTVNSIGPQYRTINDLQPHKLLSV